MLARAAWAAGVVVALAGCADDAIDDGSGGAGADTGVGAGDAAGGTTGEGGAPGDASTGGSTASAGDGGAGAGGAAPTGATGTTSSAGGGGAAACEPIPACDAPLPDLGPARDFEHTTSEIYSSISDPHHRGRDLFVNPGEPVWIIGKFTYGLNDKDLKDEEVDVWMLRDCGDTWEKVGTAVTTEEGEHPTVEGVEDSGGWVYYQLPSDLQLAPGRHRFELVVAGDLSHVPVYVDVVAPGTPLVVSDVDGTLTTSENEEFGALLTGATPDANADAAAVLSGLADKGYRVFYLTARPEFLVERTRQFIRERGFPPGLVHTTLNTTGATGDAAVAYKLGELQAIAARGLVPSWAFGNTETDAEAFFSAGIQPAEQRVMYLFEDTAFGSRTIGSYASLLPEIAALPPVCD
jgi:hypothetical protein